ncbi:MAG: 4Fe-4S dicluster domain-containing protein [Nitrospirae bacterium]|nr:4Fe-4S dicluster domain-containing protein [Nitrospirota bacterium]
MSMDRRQFIKIAGISTVLGFGGTLGLSKLKDSWASEMLQSPEALNAKHWAMVIDVKKLTSEEHYDKAISACHRAHNVPNIGNPKEEVKWLWKETYEHAFPGMEQEYMPEGIKHKPFLLLCNHCENPPCVRVCPTKATFKRESDGIVMQDMHRCIGCRFCMAACPFGARSFNWRDPRPFIKEQDENKEFPTRTKGVVEKCTFCYERLAKGEMPACVEAVKDTKALVFGDLSDPNSEVRKILSTHYSIRRKPELGTQPSVYYLIGGEENA